MLVFDYIPKLSCQFVRILQIFNTSCIMSETPSKVPKSGGSVASKYFTPLKRIGLSRKWRTPQSAKREDALNTSLGVSQTSPASPSPLSPLLTPNPKVQVNNKLIIGTPVPEKRKSLTESKKVAKRLISPKEESQNKTETKHTEKQPVAEKSTTRPNKESKRLKTPEKELITLEPSIEINVLKTKNPENSTINQNKRSPRSKAVPKRYLSSSEESDQDSEFTKRSKKKVSRKILKSSSKSPIPLETQEINKPCEITEEKKEITASGVDNFHDCPKTEKLSQISSDGSVIVVKPLTKPKNRRFIDSDDEKSNTSQDSNKSNIVVAINYKNSLPKTINSDSEDDFFPNHTVKNKSKKLLVIKSSTKGSLLEKPIVLKAQIKKKSSNAPKENGNKAKRFASLKKSLIERQLSDDDFESSPKEVPKAAELPNLKKCSVVLENITSKPNALKLYQTVELVQMRSDNHIAEDKINELKSLLSGNFSEDEDFGPSPEENLNQKLVALTKEVTLKRKELEELKRADLYKKKHDPEELKALTEKWKSGCKIALNDLLEIINQKSAAQIDLSTLCKKLNISKEYGFFSDSSSSGTSST